MSVELSNISITFSIYLILYIFPITLYSLVAKIAPLCLR